MNARPIDFRRAQRALARLDALVQEYPELREPEAQARLTAWLQGEEQRAMARQSSRRKGDPMARARQARLRERRTQSGWLQYAIWLDPASDALLKELRRPGESLNSVMARALTALAAHERTDEHPVTSDATTNVSSHDEPRHPPAMADTSYAQHKAALIRRIRTMKAEGLSLQLIANRLSAEAVPTLSGRGTWQKGTIGNLLAQAQDA